MHPGAMLGAEGRAMKDALPRPPGALARRVHTLASLCIGVVRAATEESKGMIKILNVGT